MPALSDAVRTYRLSRMRAYMRQHSLDALAFTSAEWFEWVTNHAPSELAWERPFLVIVPASGRPIAFLSEHGRFQVAAERDRGTLWVDDVTFYGESPSAQLNGWAVPQWSEMVVDGIVSASLSGARIGVDTPSRRLDAIAQRLERGAFVETGRSLRELRWVKHAEEIQTMRTAASLSDWAMQAYRDELKPGRLLASADFAISARLAEEAARRLPGENYVIQRLLTLSGPSSACPHGDGAPTGKTVEPDSVAITTVATRLNGLAMELARPWILGKPPSLVSTLFDLTLRAQTAGVDAARAGLPVSGIHASAQRVFDESGFGSHLRLRGGHGIGVVMHDFPEDVPFNDRPLFERETYAIEPGLYLPDLGGFRFSDTVAIGPAGAERLTRSANSRAAQTID